MMNKQPLKIHGEFDGIIYNELPVPYTSWADYVFWHEPWIYATNDKVIEHTVLVDGKVKTYRIEWVVARLCADMETVSSGVTGLRRPIVIALLRLRDWWRKTSTVYLKKWKRGGL